MAKLYTENDLGAIVAGEWELVGGLGARVDSGVGVIATLRGLSDPVWKHTHDIALPFPFTLEQFRAFCAWHPTFEWEAVESQFRNNDESLDKAALDELAEHGADAAELVRRFLAGESDDAPAEEQQGAKPDQQEAVQVSETTQTEVHANALIQAIATAFAQQLRNAEAGVSPSPAVEPNDAPAEYQTAHQNAPDFELLATKDQLIEAFGVFTDMNQSWFDNLKDKPGLQSAKKIDGVSGRGSIPAMFCPFEVMCWLTSTKRKAGKPIGEVKAWERLAKYFPKVYSAHSIGDPRE